MVFKKQFALAIKSKGKILREIDDKVLLPFGSEFSLVLKNLNTVKALVNVWIDGSKINENCSIVVDPNSTLELERFIKIDNLEKGHKFKFIERTNTIENHRGIKIDDGIVRIEYQFEKKSNNDEIIKLLKEINNKPTPYYPPYQPYMVPRPMWHSGDVYTNGGISYCADPTLTRDKVGCQAAMDSCEVYTSALSGNIAAQNVAQSIAGITVPGNISDQKFSLGSKFEVETEIYSLSLQLIGEVKNKKVKQVVTVKTKQDCPTCGKKNKMTSKFCSFCGTSLIIL